MQLKQNCAICERKYNTQVAKLKADNTIPNEVLELAINACPQPKSVTVEKEISLGNTILVTYSCKHTVSVNKMEYEKKDSYTSLIHNYESYDYQTEGVKFGLETGLNFLCADEQGLGKTPQSLLCLREAIKAKIKVSPVVLAVKASTLYQWIRQTKEWYSTADLAICPVVSAKNLIFPGFDIYICSMDLLPDVVDKLILINPITVIGDEVQCFKNRDSKRSKALVKLCQHGSVKHKIFLSGTPIKNRAGEYFTILNLLAPGHFPSWRQFVSRWLEPNDKGIPTRIRPYALADFRKLTSRWILRREVAEVQKDLPALRQVPCMVEITDPIIKKSYNSQLDLFSNFLNHGQKISSIELLGWLAKLRRLTAQAKVPFVVEDAKDFLENTEDRKLAIGIHHHAVRTDLLWQLRKYNPLSLSGQDSAQEKDWIVTKFQSDAHRLLVLNELSGGTGLDGLQCCADVYAMERQWNKSDEDQFSSRFRRDGQKHPVLVTNHMAHGTIDEYFADMVEEKGEICQDAYGNQTATWNFSDNTDALKELSERVIANRL